MVPTFKKVVATSSISLNTLIKLFGNGRMKIPQF